MKEFALSSTPDKSALVIVRGDVQDNHVNNFASIMRYGETAAVTTTELEDAMPMVGMTLPYRGDYAEMRARSDHWRSCAGWITDYAVEKHGFKPYRFDVHLLDGAPGAKDGEGFDAVRPHWRGVTNAMTDRGNYAYRKDDGVTLPWTYTPFSLVDKTLERFGQEQEDRKLTLAEMVEELQAARLPVRYRYATATLIGKQPGLDAARVEFTYPTNATFVRSTSPEDHRTKNELGDLILQQTEVSRRFFAPEIPVHLQIALDLARKQNNDAVEEAIERHGDDLMYMAADDGTTDYNNEARLAPILNQI